VLASDGGAPCTLFVCAGLQGSGSTFVSWCFLQRADLDGVLDGQCDLLPELPRERRPTWFWYKSTISAFRLRDMVCYFADEGWHVRPLLVARDVRSVFHSLVAKPYGRNGVTAEEPPLRPRFLRFRDDWELARSAGWPVVRYESLLCRPEPVLREACARRGLPWDPGMMEWPKRPGQIAFPWHGSETFRANRARTLAASLRPELGPVRVERVPAADLAWLEREFAEYNRVLGYPARVAAQSAAFPERSVPRFAHTRRYRRLRRNRLLIWLLRFLPGVRGVWRAAYRRSMGLARPRQKRRPGRSPAHRALPPR
jgi:hypothetical protein